MPKRARAVPASSRGFTLVELLAVVTITGILAMLAVVGFRRYMVSAHSTEALGVISAVRAAEETYRAENHVYLNVSAASGGALWYPTSTPNKTRSAFNPALHSSHADAPRWQQLGAAFNGNVQFCYLVNAGVAGTTLPAFTKLTSPPDIAAVQPLDWYAIQAWGDVDGNGVYSSYAATSLSGEVYVENEGE